MTIISQKASEALNFDFKPFIFPPNPLNLMDSNVLSDCSYALISVVPMILPADLTFSRRVESFLPRNCCDSINLLLCVMKTGMKFTMINNDPDIIGGKILSLVNSEREKLERKIMKI